MTPLPKRRWSTHRQGKKRATFKASSTTYGKCFNCGEPKPRHAVCPKCGFYREKQLMRVKQKGKKQAGGKKLENQK